MFVVTQADTGHGCNWVDTYFATHGHGGASVLVTAGQDGCVASDADQFTLYITSLYWAAMTISTVGARAARRSPPQRPRGVYVRTVRTASN